jgi:hypothetical protein
MEYAAHVGHHIEGPAPSPVLAVVAPVAIVIMAPSAASHVIGTGVDSVRLGPSFSPAARALSEDTKDAQDGQTMADGSTTVLLGADFKQLVRRNDHATCGGVVAEGIDTIFVGG